MGKIFEIIDKLPPPHSEVLRGLKWGDFNTLFTPSYWKIQYHLNKKDKTNYKLGDTLIEEVVACMLGGYGIRAELGLMAFQALKNNDLIVKNVKFKDIFHVLSKGIIKNEKIIQYRFVAQKTKYICDFLNSKQFYIINEVKGLELREALLSVNGIGPKTASWITRNWYASNEVAIIDIHLYRAGLLTGFFAPVKSIGLQYFELENKFLHFCDLLKVKASYLDVLIWNQMRYASIFLKKILFQN